MFRFPTECNRGVCAFRPACGECVRKFGRYLDFGRGKLIQVQIMKSISILVGLFSLVPAISEAQPSISSVLNAASYDAAISPGCWTAIMGSGLASTTLKPDGTAQVLPTSLGGVSVTVNGSVAELLYVSPKQINLVIPLDVRVTGNTVVPLIVTSDGVASRPYNVRL